MATATAPAVATSANGYVDLNCMAKENENCVISFVLCIVSPLTFYRLITSHMYAEKTNDTWFVCLKNRSLDWKKNNNR